VQILNTRFLTVFCLVSILHKYQCKRNKTLKYCHVVECDYRRGLDWIVDVLATLTNHLWLNLITAPSLTSIFYKSLQHTLSLCNLLCFTSRSLVAASNSGDSSAYALTSLLGSSQIRRLNPLFTDSLTTLSTLAPIVLLITSRHGPSRKHRSIFYSNRFHWNMFACEGVAQ
jgi:hypothetical protein